MIVTCVKVVVKQEYINDFINATIENHRGSRQEEGNLRFDVLQSLTTPKEFTLYEAYDSEESASEHKKTDHYLKWRETVEPWMEKPREGFAHKVIVPDDRTDW